MEIALLFLGIISTITKRLTKMGVYHGQLYEFLTLKKIFHMYFKFTIYRLQHSLSRQPKNTPTSTVAIHNLPSTTYFIRTTKKYANAYCSDCTTTVSRKDPIELNCPYSTHSKVFLKITHIPLRTADTLTPYTAQGSKSIQITIKYF